MSSSPEPPSPTAQLVLDARTIERTLRRIAHEIVEANPDLSRIALIGIPSRGVEISNRLARFIEKIEGHPIEQGSIDVSMHRDDIGQRGRLSPVQATRLPLDLATRTLILVDDVLYTGRTCRSALDSISSYGRPARIQYATLIDRGHRELPIRADYVGKNLPTSLSQRVLVRLAERDGVEDSVWIDRL